MKSNYKKLTHAFVAFSLAFTLLLQPTAFVIASTNSIDFVSSKNNTLVITSDFLVIDGISYSKSDVLSVFSKIKRLPNNQSTKDIYNNTGLDNSNTDTFKDLGITNVFMKVNFTRVMTTLKDYYKNAVLTLPSYSLAKQSRDINIVIKDEQSIYIDGVQVDFNWITYELSNYLEANMTSLEDSTTIAIRKELVNIASTYGDGQSIEAAEAMAKVLERENKEYSFAKLTTEKNYFMVSHAYPNSIVSKNGFHWGLVYDDTIYCNIIPNGLPKQDWKDNFYARLPIEYNEYKTIIKN